MAYVDSQFNTPAQETVVGTPNNPVTLGTSTGTGTTTISGTSTPGNGYFTFPKWILPTKVNNIRVYVGTAPAAAATGTTFVFLNGTATVGSAVIGTNTAGAVIDATLTSNTYGSNGTLTGPAIFTSSNGQLLMNTISSNTGAGVQLGSYTVDLVIQTYFVN